MTLPPNDVAAERFALGYAMLFDAAPLDGLTPAHFFEDANRQVFAAIAAGARGPDGVLLWLIDQSTPLPSGGKGGDMARRVGAPYRLWELIDGLPAAPRASLELQASACASSIREQWRRRVLCDAIETVALELRGGLDTSEAWERLKRACRT